MISSPSVLTHAFLKYSEELYDYYLVCSIYNKQEEKRKNNSIIYFAGFNSMNVPKVQILESPFSGYSVVNYDWNSDPILGQAEV